jgi:hypothetical protein
MLSSDDGSLEPRETSAPSGGRARPAGKASGSYDGSIRLVGHRVREVQPGVVQVEAQITREGRTFNGAASGRLGHPDRLRVPALATLRALDACLQIFYLGISEPTLTLDNVIEVSVGDFPVAVVMITATENAETTSVPLVAACPLVGMSDLAIILATLQATGRTVSHWLACGDRSHESEERERPQ